MVSPVTDPKILAELEGGNEPVSDPKILAELEGSNQPQSDNQSLGQKAFNIASDTIAGSPLGMASQATNSVGQGMNWLLDKTGIPVSSGIQNAAKSIISPFRAAGVGVAETMTPGGNGIQTTQRTMEAMQPDYQPQGLIDKVGAYVGENAPTIAAGVMSPAIGGPLAMGVQQAANTGKISPLLAIPPAMKAGESLVKPLFRKTASWLGNIPEEDVKYKMENPQAVDNAKPITEIASNDVIGAANKYDQAIEGLHGEAKKTLSTSRYIEPTQSDMGGAFTKDEVFGAIKGARRKLGGVYTPEAQAAANTLEKISENLNKIRNTVSQNQVHDLIMDLDREIPWDKVSRSPETLTLQDSALIDARNGLDTIIKNKNPAYKSVMKPLSDLIQSKKQFIKNFAIDRVKGEGYQPSNQTIPRLLGATKEERLASQRILESTKNNIGEDLSPQLMASRVKSNFEPDSGGVFQPKGLKEIAGRPLVNKTINAIPNVKSGIKTAIAVTLTDDKAREFLRQANGDKNKARQLAAKAGYTW